MRKFLLKTAAMSACLASTLSTLADTWTMVLQDTNGFRIPAIIGASGSIDSPKGFTGFDYFEWFGITHHRFWFKPSFSPLNPTGGVQDVNGFNAAVAALRANPLRQGTAGDVYFDWNRFNSEFGAEERYVFGRFRQLGIMPMMCNTVFTSEDPLADWGNKFKYWKFWYAYVYFFASQYDITLYEFRNEANAWGSYAQWESHWLVCADAMRKAMADVNRDFNKSLVVQICGPTMPGPYWNYNLPDPNKDVHGWGSVAWAKIHTDIYGNEDPSIWNFNMYDYHRYRTDAEVTQNEIATLRQNLATARNAPNSTIPLIITEYNTSTGANFSSKGLDTEDINYGINLAQMLQATATLGPAGLGDDGGFFLFKLGARDGDVPVLQNRTAYVSDRGDYNYGGISRGGVCFQMYARHFRGGKPLLGLSTSSGASTKRRAVAVHDAARRAYYVYFSNMNGTDATTVLDGSALKVEPGTPVTVQRVDANNTGEITDFLTLDATKKLSFPAPHASAFMVWIPESNSAQTITSRPPANDTYLVLGVPVQNHGTESTLRVSLHHSSALERRIGFLQFDLSGLSGGNRYLLRLAGRNAGVDPGSREILHVYGVPGGAWSETSVAWNTAPGVGRYYTATNAMASTTGLGAMTDIEDNYGGVTKGTGLGLHGKFLGPISFSSADWKTNALDITDYVRSLQASNQTSLSVVVARIVRYDVNQYSNATYYTKGVYDSNGRVVEIATKEHASAELRPALSVFKTGPVRLTWDGSVNNNWDIAATPNWKHETTPSTYTEIEGTGDEVLFDDTASGSTAVNLTTNLSPNEIRVSNTSKDYGLGGPGKLAGSGRLIKEGSGQLVITTTNDYTGGTTIEAGTLQIGDGINSGAVPGAITNHATLIFHSPVCVANNHITGTGSLSFTGTNGLFTLAGTNSYSGPTTIRNGGKLMLNSARAMPPQSTLVLGDPGGTNIGSADFTGQNVVIGGLSAGGNQKSANTISLGAGDSLVINGNVQVGNTASSGARPILKIAGPGASVMVSTNGGVIQVGATAAGAGGTANNADCDLTGLGSFTAALGSSGLVRIGEINNNTGNGNPLSVLRLAPDSTVFAGAIRIGPGGKQITPELRLGSRTSLLFTDLVSIGGGSRDSGRFLFETATGSVRLRGFGGSLARANVQILVGGTSTGTGSANVFDVAGHHADLLLDALVIGDQAARTGSWSNYFAFDQGVLDATSVSLSQACRAGTPGISVMRLGGGTVRFGSLAMASSNAAAILEITGGQVSIATNIMKTGSGVATIQVTNASLKVNGGIATPAIPLDILTLESSTLTIGRSSGTGNPAEPLVCVGQLELNGSCVLALTGSGYVPGQFPLISYTNTTISGAGFGAVAGFIPPLGFAARLVNNPVNRTIDVDIIGSTAGVVAINHAFSDGALSLSWDHPGLSLQTNVLGLEATNGWFPYPLPVLATNVLITLDPTPGHVFFRLVGP